MQCAVRIMHTAVTIKELRESTGMNRREDLVAADIPVRMLEDWGNGRCSPPEGIYAAT